MKKIIIIITAGMALVVILITGCTVNPAATSTTSMPAAPVSSSPDNQGKPEAASTTSVPASPISPSPDNQGTPETPSDVLQSSIPLKVSDPADAAEINTDSIVVKGQTVAGATVNVNDTAGIADANGNFSMTISLDQGPNAIDVIASDNSGKEGEVLIVVVVSSGSSAATSLAGPSDVSPGTVPLKVIQPVDAATLNADTVTVKGQTAPGAMVLINDQIDNADTNGNFSIDVSLVSGPNFIDVIAQDDNGNDNEVIVMVNVTS